MQKCRWCSGPIRKISETNFIGGEVEHAHAFDCLAYVRGQYAEFMQRDLDRWEKVYSDSVRSGYDGGNVVAERIAQAALADLRTFVAIPSKTGLFPDAGGPE